MPAHTIGPDATEAVGDVGEVGDVGDVGDGDVGEVGEVGDVGEVGEVGDVGEVDTGGPLTPSLAWATRALFVGLGLLLCGAGLFGTVVGIGAETEGFATISIGMITGAYTSASSPGRDSRCDCSVRSATSASTPPSHRC